MQSDESHLPCVLVSSLSQLLSFKRETEREKEREREILVSMFFYVLGGGFSIIMF